MFSCGLLRGQGGAVPTPPAKAPSSPVASSRTMNHDVAGGAADLVPSAGSDFPIGEGLAPLEQRFSTLVAHQKGLSQFKLEGLLHPYPGASLLRPSPETGSGFCF